MSAELTTDEMRAGLGEVLAGQGLLATAQRLRDAESGVDDMLLRDGFDRSRWTELTEHLGLTAIGVPEHLGGLGLGVHHLAAVVEECGTQLAGGPVRAAAALAYALSGFAGATAGMAEPSWLPGLIDGSTIPGVSLIAECDVAPTHADDRVTGRIPLVAHGATADIVLCTVRADNGHAVAAVRLDEHTRRNPLPGIDRGGPYAEVTVEQAAADLLTAPGDIAALRLSEAMGRILLAAEQVGGAKGCLASMVAYARSRTQFGRAIGSYQAVAHHCSRTAVAIASARSLVGAAAAAVARGDANSATSLALLAGAEASECFTGAADHYIQVCGGIGFTWEHDAHLYFRRARATAAVAGGSAVLRARAVELGGLELLVGSGS